MIRSMPAAVLLAVIGTAVATAAAAEPLTGKVVRIADGDTITVLDAANVQHKVRLQGIDPPERGQPFGTKARECLAAMVMGKAVTMHDDGKDKYGRTLGRIEIEGRDVNRQMVADGLAWHYVKFSKDKKLVGTERDAQAAKRGLWADAQLIAPWEWRAAKRDHKKPAERWLSTELPEATGHRPVAADTAE
jgi:endonuclease YncB( thermonuclease family)